MTILIHILYIPDVRIRQHLCTCAALSISVVLLGVIFVFPMGESPSEPFWGKYVVPVPQENPSFY